jgi:hypothetical protein
MELNGQLHALATVLPEKKPPMSTEQKASKLESLSGLCEEEKNILSCRETNPDSLDV